MADQTEQRDLQAAPPTIDPAPALEWEAVRPGLFTATTLDGVRWGAVRHAHPGAKSEPDAPEAERTVTVPWWLHRLGAQDTPPDAETYAAAPMITAGDCSPDALRYADVLVAGWRETTWRLRNGGTYGDLVMVREDQHAPLSALLGDPVMVHPSYVVETHLQLDQARARQQRLTDLATVASTVGVQLDPVVLLAVLGEQDSDEETSGV